MNILYFILLIIFSSSHIHSVVSVISVVNTNISEPLFHGCESIPISYQGRFRPLSTYAQLWVEEVFNGHPFHEAPLELLWKMHFKGHNEWDNAALFTVTNKHIKKLANLNTSEKHFSYNQLHDAFYKNKETNFNILKPLILYHFAKNFRKHASDKIELPLLTPGLWVTIKNDKIVLLSIPEGTFWQHLKPGDTIEKIERDQIYQLEKKYFRIAEDLTLLRNALSIYSRSANDLRLLPSRYIAGEWLPIQSLKLEPTNNFTLYENDNFAAIRKNYLALEKAFHLQIQDPKSQEHIQTLSLALADELQKGYSSLAGTTFKNTLSASLRYPTFLQLKAEFIYTHYPWSIAMLGAYITALCLFGLFAYFNSPLLKILALGMLTGAFCLHTFILGLRIFILERPPVSNMFETTVYVPWVAVGLSFLFYFFWKKQTILPLVASALVASSLLGIMVFNHLDNSLENVQAVLNSQYWLTVHVLMVVGSYGAFILAGLLGHYYLIRTIMGSKDNPSAKSAIAILLQLIYLGVALLTVGTILGGVWAAQSWGRFWDWDPKESWAFISISVYLIIIHAHRFKKIDSFGLAVGSIVGLLSISFTWYGVNYILGTGLHSYGFGSGGEIFYWLYFLGEAIFIGAFLMAKQIKEQRT